MSQMTWYVHFMFSFCCLKVMGREYFLNEKKLRSFYKVWLYIFNWISINNFNSLLYPLNRFDNWSIILIIAKDGVRFNILWDTWLFKGCICVVCKWLHSVFISILLSVPASLESGWRKNKTKLLRRRDPSVKAAQMSSFDQTLNLYLACRTYMPHIRSNQKLKQMSFLKIMFKALRFDWARGLKNLQQIHCKTNHHPQAVLTIA